MILQLHDRWTPQEIPAIYKSAGIVWTWSDNAQAFQTNAAGARKLANAPRSTTTPAGEWQLIVIPGPFGQAASARLLPPGALDIAIERAKILTKYPLWPPISWENFKPNTYYDILNHYYAYSPGCKNTATANVLKFVGPALAIALAPLTAGLSSFLIATGAKAVGAVVTSGFLAGLANDAIKKAVTNAIDPANLSPEVKEAMEKRRKNDSWQEQERIKDAYWKFYRQPYGDQFMKGLQTADLGTLEAAVQMTEQTVAGAKAKCEQSTCDTAGCRSYGWAVLRLQYATLLRDAMQGANVYTPAAYNAKMAAAIDAELKAAGLPPLVDGAGPKKAALGNFLILGAIFSGLLKKS